MVYLPGWYSSYKGVSGNIMITLTRSLLEVETDLDTLLARLTAARAGYLDELAAANLPTDIATIDTVVDAIKAMTDGMEVLTETGGTITSILGAEVTVYRNNAPAGVFTPRVVKIATSAHTATETITVREYYRLESGGALLLHDSTTYVGLIPKEEITVRLDPNRFGIEVTLELDAGTPQAYPWEVFYGV